jgi:hypothetical protein
MKNIPNNKLKLTVWVLFVDVRIWIVKGVEINSKYYLKEVTEEFVTVHEGLFLICLLFVSNKMAPHSTQ